MAPAARNRFDLETRFKVKVSFRHSIARLDDGSTRDIDQHYAVVFEAEVREITVEKVVEKLGESIPWGSAQEVELRVGNDRIQSSEQMDNAIVAGWESKEVVFVAEIIDLSKNSRARYIPSKVAECLMDEDFLVRSAHVPSDEGPSAKGSASGSGNASDNSVMQIVPVGCPLRPVSSQEHVVSNEVQGNAEQAENSNIDWENVEIADATEDNGQVIDEVFLYRLLGIDVDAREEPPLPPQAKPKRKESGRPPNPAAPPSGFRHAYSSGPSDADMFEDAGPEVDDENEQETFCVYDKKYPVFEVGRLWPNLDEFKSSFRTYAINKEFDVKVAWSDKKRLYARCKLKDGEGEKCPWFISARVQPDGRTVRVNQMPFEHTCKTCSQNVSSMTSQAWIAERVKDTLAVEPNTPTVQLKKDLEKQFPVTLNYNTVWKGKQRAMRELYGDWNSTFRMLYNFKAEVELRSLGSIVEVHSVKSEDGQVYFSRFFMTLKPCIDGFKAGCRPYLSIDATALNGKWNGQLAACNGLDGHNWMYPVAIGLFQSETEDDWTWFLTHLDQALGPISPLAVHTDACKGLENAVKKVFPHAEHRECFGHLWLNLIKKFRGDEFGRMWPAARAYKLDTWEYHRQKIFAKCPQFAEYLATYHSHLWYRSGFNTAIKCDYIHNNLAECFNNWIRDIKDLPAHDLVDKIRGMIMSLFDKRRAIGEKLRNDARGDKLPAVVQQLMVRSRGIADHLKVVRSSTQTAEVRDFVRNRRHVVDIGKHDCTCLAWQHTGKPCEHAVMFLVSKQNLMMGQYVHEYFSIERFRAAYAPVVPPLTDQHQWPEVNLDFEIKAPIKKRNPGRPKQLRFKRFLERGGRKAPKCQMKGNPNRCNRCEELGHRAGSSRCPMSGTKKRKRKGKKQVHEDPEKDGVVTTKKGRYRRNEAPDVVLEGSADAQDFEPPEATEEEVVTVVTEDTEEVMVTKVKSATPIRRSKRQIKKRATEEEVVTEAIEEMPVSLVMVTEASEEVVTEDTEEVLVTKVKSATPIRRSKRQIKKRATEEEVVTEVTEEMPVPLVMVTEASEEVVTEDTEEVLVTKVKSATPVRSSKRRIKKRAIISL